MKNKTFNEYLVYLNALHSYVNTYKWADGYNKTKLNKIELILGQAHFGMVYILFVVPIEYIFFDYYFGIAGFIYFLLLVQAIVITFILELICVYYEAKKDYNNLIKIIPKNYYKKYLIKKGIDK